MQAGEQLDQYVDKMGWTVRQKEDGGCSSSDRSRGALTFNIEA